MAKKHIGKNRETPKSKGSKKRESDNGKFAAELKPRKPKPKK